MVKFSKQLDGQVVQEWRAAYVNYKALKKDLKHMKQVLLEQRLNKVLPSPQVEINVLPSPRMHEVPPSPRVSIVLPSPRVGKAAPSPRVGKAAPSPRVRKEAERIPTGVSSMQDSFVALTGAAWGVHRLTRRRSQVARDPVVQVKKADGDPSETIYETDLTNLNELDAAFFVRLDAEFNKVNKFYRTKEKDFISQADALEKQMTALVEMRKSYAEQEMFQESLASSHRTDNDAESGREMSGSSKADDSKKTNVFRTFIGSKDAAAGALGRDDSERENRKVTEAPEAPLVKRGNDSALQMTMRLKVPNTTPSTFWEDVVKRGSSSSEDKDHKATDPAMITKKKLQQAEKLLRVAFIEYYRGLTLLKSYSSLNVVAFAKILKKYDKVSGQRAAAAYLKVVETSYFNTSVKVVKLIDRVEVLFTEQFASYNRRKAMTFLRPAEKRASHYVTFALGLFSGGSLALLIVLGILFHQLLPKYRPVSERKQQSATLASSDVYFESVFPVFSMIGLILVQLYMWGANLYLWRIMRINYPFIFEFKPGTELRHREVLMVASILNTLFIGAMVGQVTLHNTTLSPYVDLIPFGLVLMLVILLIFPFNTFYRSSRVFLLRALLHIVGTPLYKVVLTDFFLADQLTSQVTMLMNMEYVICYYLGGFFVTGSPHKCTKNNVYIGFTYLISLLPYWWRMMQCVRRYVDEVDNAHVANGFKYFSALVAVAVRIAYGHDSSQFWLGMAIMSSIVATFYQVYWDLVVDWGLLRRDSKNKWLRDELIMPRKKYVYFLSMVVNVVLRMAWLQSVTRFRFSGMNQQVTNFLFAALEIVRRGHWNFYRLENEHLNNVGKYRATKAVPLPFEDPTKDN